MNLKGKALSRINQFHEQGEKPSVESVPDKFFPITGDQLMQGRSGKRPVCHKRGKSLAVADFPCLSNHGAVFGDRTVQF